MGMATSSDMSFLSIISLGNVCYFILFEHGNMFLCVYIQCMCVENGIPFCHVNNISQPARALNHECNSGYSSSSSSSSTYTVMLF